MKSNNVSRQATNSVSSGSDMQELVVFNRRRTARGLLPVTQEEFNELLMKMAGFASFQFKAPTFH
jgi:hypothetical protein